MDIQMPVMDGLEATRRLLDPPGAAPKVIILTTFELDAYVFEALRAGASGFLVKNAPPEDLVTAIRSVMAGGGLLSPGVTARVIAAFAHRRPGDRDARQLATLTEREREVLGLVARGLTNGEIAGRLVLGEATVKTHVSNIFAKLGVRDRVGAVIIAYESGLIEVGEIGEVDPGRARDRPRRRVASAGTGHPGLLRSSSRISVRRTSSATDRPAPPSGTAC